MDRILCGSATTIEAARRTKQHNKESIGSRSSVKIEWNCVHSI
jgi:hypothetical protein